MGMLAVSSYIYLVRGFGTLFSLPNEKIVGKFEFQILTIIMTRPSPHCIYIASLVCASIAVFATYCSTPGAAYAEFHYIHCRYLPIGT